MKIHMRTAVQSRRRLLALVLAGGVLGVSLLSGCSRKPSPSSSAASRAVESVTTSSAATSAASSSAPSSQTSSKTAGETTFSEADATSLINKYIALEYLIITKSTEIVKELGLSETWESVPSANDQEKLRSTATYAEYREAMCQYVSEALFESKFMKPFKVENGMLIENQGAYDYDAGAPGHIERLTCLGDSGGVLLYKVEGKSIHGEGPVWWFWREQVNLVRSRDHYVVDSTQKIEDGSPPFRYTLIFDSADFPQLQFDGATNSVSGIPVNTSLQDFDQKLLDAYRYHGPEDYEREHPKFAFFKDGQQITKGTIEVGMTIQYQTIDIFCLSYLVKELLP